LYNLPTVLRAQKRYRQLSPGAVPATMTGDEAQTVTVPLEIIENLPELKVSF
jgi:hypothetical protein